MNTRIFISMLLLLVCEFAFSGPNTYYLVTQERTNSGVSDAPVKLSGWTFNGPATSIFWESSSSGARGSFLVNVIGAGAGAQDYQWMPTRVTEASIAPARWVSDTHALANYSFTTELSAVLKNPDAKSTGLARLKAKKIESAELVIAAKDPQSKSEKEFRAPVEIDRINLSSWSEKDVDKISASALRVDPAKDLKLPQSTLKALGDSVSRFAKEKKVDSSDLDVRLLISFKLEDGTTQTRLLSARSYQVLDELNLRGFLNAVGYFNGERNVRHFLTGESPEARSISSQAVKPETRDAGATLDDVLEHRRSGSGR